MKTHELSSEAERTSRSRAPAFLRTARVLLACEFLAFVLLKLRLSAEFSLGAATICGLLFLLRSAVISAAAAWLRGTRRLIQMATALPGAILRRIRSRSTYRFRLSTLLLATLVIAALCAWYSSRWHELRLEQRRLAGKWRVLNSQGVMVVINEMPVVYDFEKELRDGSCTIDPAHEPKRIDFHSATGTSMGIYRWEGDRLRIAQSSSNALRPTSFDPRVPPPSAGAPPTAGGVITVSCSHWLLERVADE